MKTRSKATRRLSAWLHEVRAVATLTIRDAARSRAWRRSAALPIYCVAALLLPALSTHCLAVGGPPVVTTQPLSQTRPAGSSVTLTVVVSSVTFPTYQWRLNGVSIYGATASTYTIGNVQPGHAGNYSVAVTNAVGWTVSSNAVLSVTVPPFAVAAWGNNSSGQATVPVKSNSGGTQVVNTSGCTPEPGDPICGVLGGCPSWFTFIPLDSGMLFLNTDGSSYDTVMAVYRRSTNNPLILQQVACDNNSGLDGRDSALSVPVVGGVTNYVLVDGVNGASGTLRFNYNLVPTPDTIKAIAAGGEHSLALRSNGTVLAWGANTYGQTNVPAGLTNVTAIAAGYYHSLALRSDGKVVAWGRNSDGETNVPPGLSNVVALSAGCHHNLALRNDGTVVAWGRNASGETNVPSGLTNVAAIAAGCSHSLALKDNGIIAGWGNNDHGQLNVPSGLAGVATLSAGNDFSLALRANRTVVAWGDNTYGQTNVPVGLSNVVAITGGGSHSLALRANGTIAGWGQNANGQIPVPPGMTNMIAIAAGASHSMALQGDGSIVITVQPRNQRVYRYATGTFSVMAVGNSPIVYQWRRAGTNIVGATSSIYTLTNVLPADAGTYSVDVIRDSGIVPSSNATLAVEYPTALVVSPRSSSNNIQFDVAFTASSDSPVPVGYSVQGSTNFIDWTHLQVGLLTFTNQAQLSFGELMAPGPSRRFYRVLLP